MDWIESFARNREPERLNFDDIRVIHADGVARFDPNAVAVACYRTGFEKLRPVPGEFSCLSAQPALVLREDDVRIPLTRLELVRFVAHALLPEEFAAIHSRFGRSFSWHDDFYDFSTGAALQPMFSKRELAKALQREPAADAGLWPVEPDVARTATVDCLHFLVRHPMVASGNWQVRNGKGQAVPPAALGLLAREDVLSNIQHLADLRQQVAAPSARAISPQSPRP